MKEFVAEWFLIFYFIFIFYELHERKPFRFKAVCSRFSSIEWQSKVDWKRYKTKTKYEEQSKVKHCCNPYTNESQIDLRPQIFLRYLFVIMILNHKLSCFWKAKAQELIGAAEQSLFTCTFRWTKYIFPEIFLNEFFFVIVKAIESDNDEISCFFLSNCLYCMEGFFFKKKVYYIFLNIKANWIWTFFVFRYVCDWNNKAEAVRWKWMIRNNCFGI